MAKVREGDRAKTKKLTGSSKYPMQTGAQIRSAIKLRSHGKGISAGTVLSRASAAVTRLLKAGKISAGTAKSLRNLISRARQKGSSK